MRTLFLIETDVGLTLLSYLAWRGRPREECTLSDAMMPRGEVKVASREEYELPAGPIHYPRGITDLAELSQGHLSLTPLASS
jgi:hypothetical protein